MTRSEECGEISPDCLNSGNNLPECLGDTEWPRLALEDYLKGKVEMHVHYVLGIPDQKSGKFCAVLKAYEGYGDSTIEDRRSIFDGRCADQIRSTLTSTAISSLPAPWYTPRVGGTSE